MNGRQYRQLVTVSLLLQAGVALVVGGQAELSQFAFEHQHAVHVQQRVCQQGIVAQLSEQGFSIGSFSDTGLGRLVPAGEESWAVGISFTIRTGLGLSWFAD